MRKVQPDIKVILNTAYTQDSVMRNADKRNIRGFIRKPYRTEELVAMLKQVATSSAA